MSRIVEHDPKKGLHIRCTQCGTNSIGNLNGQEFFECRHGKYWYVEGHLEPELNGSPLIKYTIPRVTRFVSGKVVTDD